MLNIRFDSTSGSIWIQRCLQARKTKIQRWLQKIWGYPIKRIESNLANRKSHNALFKLVATAMTLKFINTNKSKFNKNYCGVLGFFRFLLVMGFTWLGAWFRLRAVANISLFIKSLDSSSLSWMRFSPLWASFIISSDILS